MRRLIATMMLASVAIAPLAAEIPTPPRPVTDPKSLTSPVDPDAKPVPIDDLGFSRGAVSAAWSADSKQFFIATDLTGRFNIWRGDVDGSWPVQLSQSEEVQRGIVPARDGKTILFRQDQGGNEQYDIFAMSIDGGVAENITNTPDVREAGVNFSRKGDLITVTTKKTSEGQVNIAVMDLATRKVRPLTAEKNPAWRWTPAAWVEGDNALIASRTNADGSVGEVWRIDVATGKATRLLGKANTLYTATDATADGKIIALTTNDGTGQLHAVVYDVAAKKQRKLPSTPWEESSGSISPDDKSMLVQTSIDGRQEVALVDLETLSVKPLALPPGDNSATGSDPFSPDGRKLMVIHAGADTPAELYAYDLATSAARPITRLAMASLAPEHLPKSRIVTYRSFDGTLVSAVLTMPFNLKRDGSNPAVVIPHGGPTGQTIDSFEPWATALASRGYVVIQPNPRGSTGYGIAFQKANYKDLGGGDLKDELAARDFLVASGFVDAKRVGIAGGSYGGFMTLMAIGKAPDAFAAAVDLFGIIDWGEMWKHEDALLQAYQRGLIGSPDDSPEVYIASSPLTYIKAAKAPLLVTQGENDIRVPPGQSRQVMDVLKAKGNIVEGVFYPGEGHGFYKRENNTDSLKRMVAWFDKYLAAPGK